MSVIDGPDDGFETVQHLTVEIVYCSGHTQFLNVSSSIEQQSKMVQYQEGCTADRTHWSYCTSGLPKAHVWCESRLGGEDSAQVAGQAAGADDAAPVAARKSQKVLMPKPFSHLLAPLK